MPTEDADTLHATAVAVRDRAVLITGASGSGKSSLALEMLARGATLVADDRVIVNVIDDHLMAGCPETLKGLIEARGVGILHAASQQTARIVLVVDLDTSETERIPPERTVQILGKTLPLLHNVASQHFPAAIIQYLRKTQN